jgi:exonuclease SbcD
MLKILHTSDWHLGRTLYGRRRYQEFEAFLNWLAEAVDRNAVTALIVAGDVFDTGTPGNRAQELYYRFLCRMAASSCRHVVITAGNHDSPSFLNAPKELLKALDVHVVGSIPADPQDQILILRDQAGAPELIVCAVPYLRDRDVRTAEPGESIADKEKKLLRGIRDHYAVVGALAEERRAELGADIPILATGHLFAGGGKTLDGDGVRELYVGSLAHVSASIFPPCFNYLALGHLHVPQTISGLEAGRYSGSPLPMGFGEAGQQKSVCLITFEGLEASVELLDVPVFQELKRISGDWTQIETRLHELIQAGSRAWLEIVYTGADISADLRQNLDETIAGTDLEILRVKNDRVMERVLQGQAAETLDDLDVYEVFERCLAAHDVPFEQQEELIQAYREILTLIHEEDIQFGD